MQWYNVGWKFSNITSIAESYIGWCTAEYQIGGFGTCPEKPCLTQQSEAGDLAPMR